MFQISLPRTNPSHIVAPFMKKLIKNQPLTRWQVYKVKFLVSQYTCGEVTAIVGGTPGTPRSGNGMYEETIIAGKSNTLGFELSDDFDGNVEKVSLRAASIGVAPGIPAGKAKTTEQQLSAIREGHASVVPRLSTDNKYQLEQAVLQLGDLLEFGEERESAFQEFFEDNPVVFRVLGYQRGIPFTKASKRSLPRDENTNLKPEPDFLVERENGTWEIFEIKTPVAYKLTIDRNEYRKRFSSKVSEFISQVLNYNSYFSQHSNLKAVRKKFDIDIQPDPAIKIVIGWQKHSDQHLIADLCKQLSKRPEIIFYDELYKRLRSGYEFSFGKMDTPRGYSIAGLFRLRRPPEKGNYQFINAVSLCGKSNIDWSIDAEKGLLIELSGGNGDYHVLQTRLDPWFDVWVSMVVTFAIVGERTQIALYMDGQEWAHVSKIAELPRIADFYLNLGRETNNLPQNIFDIASIALFERPINFIEISSIASNFLTTLREPPLEYLSFTGKNYMKQMGSCLSQPERQHRPYKLSETPYVTAEGKAVPTIPPPLPPDDFDPRSRVTHWFMRPENEEDSQCLITSKDVTFDKITEEG